MELNAALSKSMRAGNDTAMSSKIPSAVSFHDIDIPVHIVAHGHIRPAKLRPCVMVTGKVDEVFTDIAPTLLNGHDALVIGVKKTSTCGRRILRIAIGNLFIQINTGYCDPRSNAGGKAIVAFVTAIIVIHAVIAPHLYSRCDVACAVSISRPTDR